MNEKNLAPKNIEGTYTLTIEGKTISITDSSGHTKTANCAPDDTFNLGEGVNLAMSRLHDKTIRVGDIVTVTRPGQCYSTYIGWIERIEFFIWLTTEEAVSMVLCVIFKSAIEERLMIMRLVI